MKAIIKLKPRRGEKNLPEKPVRVLGIDLGTTNSTVAEILWDPSRPDDMTARCLEVQQHTREGTYTNVLVPSVVALLNEEEYVGEGAKRLRAASARFGLEQNKSIFYECKNDIGLRKTYHRAPEGYRSAAQIASHVLDFLAGAAKGQHEKTINRTVVTVPASFQLAQRSDTVMGATLAGMNLSGGNLLDEPVAAFLDYIVNYEGNVLDELRALKNLLVFDFGGGTCDVAVFQLSKSRADGGLEIAPLAVSRYHRLGGGDIDAAIVYEVLLPQIIDQNELTPFDLTYEDKKKYIEPAFLSVAEALKTGLCIEISRLQKFGQYESRDKNTIVKKQPGVHVCHMKDRTLKLQSPQLSAARFEEILEPFLEEDLLYPRETDYRWTCSIFAPLQDALDRSGFAGSQIDLCLLVGGSSLIPQVVEAVSGYFSNAKVLTYTDRESLQVAVARGAAIHALALELFGKGLIQPICQDTVSIRTATGSIELIPKGAPLPYPSEEEFKQYHDLAVPETTVSGSVPLRVEFVAGKDDERTIFSQVWKITTNVKRGSPLLLKYRLDENQILTSKLMLPGLKSRGFSATFENPFTNVVNPQSKKIRIEEVEEDLRTGKVPEEDIADTLVELAGEYAELGQREKAIEYLKRALRGQLSPDFRILHLLGWCYGEIGDYERQEKAYREAASAEPSRGVSLFNLALAQRKRGQLGEAAETIDGALAREYSPPYLVLKAQILKSLGRDAEYKKALEEGLNSFNPVAMLDDWTLGWFIFAARMAGNQDKLKEAENEQRTRRKGKPSQREDEGLLPIVMK